jgi:exosortase/archaeosortase family protein
MTKAKPQSALPKEDRAAVGLVMRFAMYFAVFSAAILFADKRGLFDFLRIGTTAVATTVVTWVGIPATRSGTLIYLPTKTLAIDLACTAIFIVALYAAIVLAYPVSVPQRLLGLAIGVPIILVGNILRLVAAAGVAQVAPSSFTFFHDYLFQVGMVLITVAAWAAWLSVVRRDAR